MHMHRFDFGSLQDFRMPPKPVEAFTELSLVVPEEPAAPPPPPTFSEQELEVAKKQAFEEGRLAGVKQGIEQAQQQHSERDAAIERAAHTLVHQAMDIQSRHVALMQAQCQELTQLVLLIGKKVAGDAIATQPAQAVETLVRECLAVLVRQPSFTLSVHPSLTNEMSARLAAIAAKLRSSAEIQVEPDASLALGEGMLSWKDGFAERKLESLWEQISEKLQSVDFTAIADAALTASAPSSADSHPMDHQQANDQQPETKNEGESL